MGEEYPLDGRTAIVTGASSGIGRSSALALGAAGADVALAARREEELQAIASEIESAHDVRSVVYPTNVTDESAVDALVEATVQQFGGLDVVLANAGTGLEPGIDVDGIETEQYRHVMDVNVDGMFFTARAAIPHLRESEGTLIFVGSFAGQYPRPTMPLYAATKWWTRGFALSLAAAIGEDGVGVSVINPSEVRTRFGRDHWEEGDLFTERFDPGDVTAPEDIAEAVVFAAKQEPPNTVTELDLYRRDKFSGF